MDEHEAMAAEHLGDADEPTPSTLSEEELDVEWKDDFPAAADEEPVPMPLPKPIDEEPVPTPLPEPIVDESPVEQSDDLPLIRPYELPPVVREYQLRSAPEELTADVSADVSADITADITADTTADTTADITAGPPKKPGFWARLFGRRAKEPPPSELESHPSLEFEAREALEASDALDGVAVGGDDENNVSAVDATEIEPEPLLEPESPIESEAPIEPETPIEPEPYRPAARLDRPSLEFFQRVESVHADRDVDSPSDDDEVVVLENADDIAALFDGPAQPMEATLDDALPMDDTAHAGQTVDAAGDTDFDKAWPSEIDVVPPIPEKKPGFFARLFGRKKQAPEPVETQMDAGSRAAPEAAGARDDSFAAAEEAFSTFGQQEKVESVAEDDFTSVDDALPSEAVPEPERSPFAPPAPLSQPASWSFEPPAPPPSFDKSFSTLEMDTPAVPMPEAASDSRPTLEFESGEFESPSDSRPTLEFDSGEFRAPAGAAAVAAVDDSRSTAQVPFELEDESTDEFIPPTPPEVSAEAEAERPPFFVPKFRSFYNEVVAYKNQKAEFTAGFATAIVDYTADLSPDNSAQTLSKRLQEILELQAAEAMWMGGEAAARYPDAQYAMASLADELFMNTEWPGREGWPRYRLEQKLFKTAGADIEFFKRVDKLLKNEAHKPTAAAKDLARLYLLVLASGFQGKYRPFNLPRPLAEYRRRLYEFVYSGDPLMIYADDRQIFPEATTRTVAGRAVSRFSLLQQWAAVLVVLLIGYAVISQIAWNRVSADLEDVTARVEAANSSTTSDGTAGEPR